MRILMTTFPVLLFLLLFQCVKGQFHAIHIPEFQLSKMKIDGDSSDWNWVLREKYASRISMTEFLWGPPVGLDSLNCKFAVGWNEITNRIYVQGIVYDKKRGPTPIRIKPHWWFGDCMELMCNPLSNVLEGHALKYRFTFPVANKPDEISLDIGPTWIKESKTDIEFAGRLWKAKDGSYVAVYEISISLWDIWDKRGPAFSKRHQLADNQQFPFGIWFDNDTYQDQELLAQWSTSGIQQAFKNPFELSRFVMDAPVEKEESWPGINRVLMP